jgi:hypothetical protein
VTGILIGGALGRTTTLRQANIGDEVLRIEAVLTLHRRCEEESWRVVQLSLYIYPGLGVPVLSGSLGHPDSGRKVF